MPRVSYDPEMRYDETKREQAIEVHLIRVYTNIGYAFRPRR